MPLDVLSLTVPHLVPLRAIGAKVVMSLGQAQMSDAY